MTAWGGLCKENAVICLFAIFVVLDFWIKVAVESIPPDSFGQPFLAVAFLQALFQLSWKHLLFLLPITLLVAIRCSSVKCGWPDLENGQAIRFVVVTAAAVLAWPFSTYDYNLYLDQAHMLDRLLLISLFAAVIWRPTFAGPFLLILLPLIAQLEVPLGGFRWTIPYLPIRVLVLFVAMQLTGPIGQGWKTSHFRFGLGCLLAAHYWPSGWGKLKFAWLSQDHVYFLLPSTYANGWLGRLEPETIDWLTSWLATLNTPIKLATLGLECGALLFLWKRQVSLVMLAGWILFHVGIFLASGICLWQWCAVELAILLVAWKSPCFFDGYSKRRLWLSVALILGMHMCIRPAALAWLDARATYTYRFRATTETGREIWLAPDFFAPVQYEFSLNQFHYVVRQPTLPVGWGATSNPAIAALLVNARTAEEVLAIERKHGAVRYERDGAIRLERFLKRFIGNYNRRRSKVTWLSTLAAPPRVWTYSDTDPYAITEAISSVDVHQLLSFYDGGRYNEIRTRPVLELEIPITDLR